MLSIEEITDFQSLLSLEKEWNEVLHHSDSNSVFLTFEWVTTWWKHFGQDKELFIQLVQDGGKIIGIVPCMIRRVWRKTSHLKKIEFIGTGVAPWGGFHPHPKKERSLASRCQIPVT